MSSVYSQIKIFHFPERIAALAAGQPASPVHVRIKPTNRCTHRCVYCCYRNENLYVSEGLREQDEIPRGKMREVIEDLHAMDVRAVTLSGGGEPLCYPYIEETVAGLVTAGIKVAMLTHGGLLGGPVATLLAEQATWLRVSIDAADAELYARNRRVRPDEFVRVCENIRAFASLPGRRCVLGINYIVTRENAAATRACIALAKALGADHVKVSGAVVSTGAQENAAYQAGYYDEVKTQLADAQATLADARFAIIDKVHLPAGAAEDFDKHYHWCPFAALLTVIAADQNVYTCQDKAYTRSGLLGSLRARRFAELWASTALQARLRALDPSSECRHHCVAHAKNSLLHDYFAADQEHLDFV
jgi:wyosine [tRNA(Phe)-imidazoG37] synthetase (radical SAM superfamily)